MGGKFWVKKGTFAIFENRITAGQNFVLGATSVRRAGVVLAPCGQCASAFYQRNSMCAKQIRSELMAGLLTACLSP